MKQVNVFVGYDKAETVAYHACCESLISNSSLPVVIHPLYLPQLTLSTPKHIPGYPPSNGFIFSRFLVPYLMGYKGRAIFLDGDMIVKGDIAELIDLPMYREGVKVVKHDYKPRQSVKYLNSVNQAYPRKNWSSVILWDCGYFPNHHLTPEMISIAEGSYLHRFQWLLDEEIGELPKEWNYLVGEDNQCDPKDAKLIHWTNGTPCFRDYLDAPHAEEWIHYKTEMNSHKEVPL